VIVQQLTEIRYNLRRDGSLRKAKMASEIPAKFPYPDGQPMTATPGQPIMYQMAPGQAPPGQPATTAEGQPIQNFHVPVSQPVQPGPPVQPMFVRGTPGQPVQSGPPMYIQETPGQPVQPGQPVHIQGAPGQPVQPQQQLGQGGFDLNIDTDFLKSPQCFIKIAEFVALLGAWASIVKYVDGEDPLGYDKADLFKGITIFSWVVVIISLSIYALSLPKICKCKRPSLFTITSVVVCFILFSLVLACTANLVPRAVDLGDKYLKKPSTSREKKAVMPYIIALDVALAFGFLSSILFVVDMVMNYKVFQTQRAQEIPSEPGMQRIPPRRVWDINYEYFRSRLFNVKLAEMVLLFGAWVCMLKYFDRDIFKNPRIEVEDSKEDFFKGITIWAWVMVILLALTVIFSFDKIGSRSSPWTLMTLIFYVLMSILLIACCGNLTPRAIDFGKEYNDTSKEVKQSVLALLLGLGLGYFAWIIFLLDIVLIYNLYRKQRMQEFRRQQLPGQPGIQQAAVVIMSQNIGEGGKQQVFQPTAHAGQQPFQNPGQHSVMMGAPPQYNPQLY